MCDIKTYVLTTLGLNVILQILFTFVLYYHTHTYSVHAPTPYDISRHPRSVVLTAEDEEDTVCDAKKWAALKVGSPVALTSATMSRCSVDTDQCVNCNADSKHVYVAADPKNAHLRTVEIRLPANTYGVNKGVQAYMHTKEMPKHKVRKVAASYDVYFPQSFEFGLGGKLPGVFGGIHACTGMRKPVPDCFSARMMWREYGIGETYMYLPRDTPRPACLNTRCFGGMQSNRCSLDRGEFVFMREKWHSVRQEVDLKEDTYKLYFDDKLISELHGLALPVFKQWGLIFTVFRGGSDASWSVPKKNSVLFRQINLELS